MVNMKIATRLLVSSLLLHKVTATIHDLTTQRHVNEINGQDENGNESNENTNKNNNTRTLRANRNLQGKGKGKGGYYGGGSSKGYYHNDFYYQHGKGKGKGKGGYYPPPPKPCLGFNCGPDYTYPTPVPDIPIATTCSDGTIGPIDPDTCINVCPDDGSPALGCIPACPSDGSRPDNVFCARICELGTNNVPVGCREKCCDDSDPVPTPAPQDPIATTCPDGSTGPVDPDACVDVCDETGFLVPGCRPACEGTSSDPADCVDVCVSGSNNRPAGCQEACCFRDICPDGENMAPVDPDNCVIACGNGVNDECVVPCPTDGSSKPFYCTDICTGNNAVDEDDCLDLCCPESDAPTSAPQQPIATTCSDGSTGPINPDTCIDVCDEVGFLLPGCRPACEGTSSDPDDCVNVCIPGSASVPAGCQEACCRRELCDNGVNIAPNDPSDCVVECGNGLNNNCVIPCPTDGSTKPFFCTDICTGSNDDEDNCLDLCCPNDTTAPTPAPQEPIATTCPDGSIGPIDPEFCVDICPADGSGAPGCFEACPVDGSAASPSCIDVCEPGSNSVPAGCVEACCFIEYCAADPTMIAPPNPNDCVLECPDDGSVFDGCVVPCPVDPNTPRPALCVDICTGSFNDPDDCEYMCCEESGSPTPAPQVPIATTCLDGSTGPFDPETCVDVCPTDGSRPIQGCVDACPTDGSDFPGFCVDICQSGSNSIPTGCQEACCSKEACPLDPDMVAPPVPDDCVLECPDDGSFFDGCVVPCPTDPDAFRPTGCVDICTGSFEDAADCEYICCRESAAPSIAPTEAPSPSPSAQPSEAPSPSPSAAPSPEPSMIPTVVHSVVPTLFHSSVPSLRPSAGPSPQPSIMPTPAPSVMPSLGPSPQPSGMPSEGPSPSPSKGPSPSPSKGPSPSPSLRPSPSPTINPTDFPTAQPVIQIRPTCPDGDMIAPKFPTFCKYECPATGVRPSDCVVFCDENPTDPDCLPVCDGNVRITDILGGICAEKCCGEPEPVPTDLPTAQPVTQIRPTCPDGDMVAPIFPRFCADECPTTGQRPTGCVVFCDINPNDPNCSPVCDEDVTLTEVLNGSCAERCCDVATPTPAPSCPPVGGGLRPAIGVPEGCELPTAAPQANIVGPPSPTISRPLPPSHNAGKGKGKGKGKGGGYYYYGYRD